MENKRLRALTLAALMIMFSLLMGAHMMSCQSEDCACCALIRSLPQGLIALCALSGFAINGSAARFCATKSSPCVTCGTPVSLKTLLLD